MNYEEISEILNSALFEAHEHDPSFWMYEDVYTSIEEINNAIGKYGFECSQEFKDEIAKLGNIKMVENFGGEGKGDDYYKVYHFIDHDVYIKFQGWYASHQGSEYEEMYEVRPKEVTTTQYNRL